jgi:hypothetical protein
MKKLFILFTIFLLSITGLFYVQAEEISDQKVVNLYFFW